MEINLDFINDLDVQWPLDKLIEGCDITRQKVIERKDIEDIFYKSLEEVIEYLTDIKSRLPVDAIISQHWTGYEDVNLVIEYIREETDEEYENRIRRYVAHMNVTKNVQYEQYKTLKKNKLKKLRELNDELRVFEKTFEKF